MTDENEFMRRRRAQLEAAKKGISKAPVEPDAPEEAPPQLTTAGRTRQRSRNTMNSADEVLALARNEGHSDEEMRKAGRELNEQLRKSATGVEYKGPLIDRETALRLDAILRSATIKTNTDSAYQDAVKTVRDWTPEQIVDFINKNVDGHLKSHPAFAQALKERADHYFLFDIV
ncbi:MAG: hypothetical protein Q7K39_01865 [Candidatus Magasanikbacteria bacterium]|nr:hypothetical protein [Candidatus Magasanikbacteria bacterium]